MFTKKRYISSNEERGRHDGAGWKRRNRFGSPEEKIIWNHYRLSEDMGKVFSHINGYEQYRRGFMSVIETNNKRRGSYSNDRHEAKP